MGWTALNAYELRNLPSHLAAAGRAAELRETLTDTEYLRAALNELGALELGETVADHAPRLHDLVERNGAFLAGGQYRGYAGPFANHLAVSAARDAGDLELAAELWWDTGAIDQEGWLELDRLEGEAVAVRRFFVPGSRQSFGWDIYSAGPAGLQVGFAVDLRRERLLAEAVELYHDDFVGTQPAFHRWRIWDLASGELLFEHGAREAGQRPAAFAEPGLAQSAGGPRVYGRVDDAPPQVTDRLARVTARLKCANGPEELFTGEDGDGPRVIVLREGVVVTDSPVPRGVEPRLCARVGGGLSAFGRGSDEHLYRIELGPPEPRAAPAAGPSPAPKAAPPEVREMPKQLGYGDGADNYAVGWFTPPGIPYVFELRRRQIGVWRSDGEPVDVLALTRDWYGGGGWLAGFAVSPDGTRVISTWHGNRVAVWNLDEIPQRPPPHPPDWRLPDWHLGEIEMASPVTHITFLWDGWLVAVATEEHELLVLRFWSSSAILARIGLDETVQELHAHGDVITCVGASGRQARYRFAFLPGRMPDGYPPPRVAEPPALARATSATRE